MRRSSSTSFDRDFEDSFDGDFDSDFSEYNETPYTRTENGALSLDTTKDPRVDLFYKTIRNLDETKLRTYLASSWNINSLDTLRLIFFIRDIRGKGKGEKKLFQQSFRWLMDTHPEAVRVCAKHIPFYGCYKDWLEIFLKTKYEKSMLKSFAKQLKKDLELVQSTFEPSEIKPDVTDQSKKEKEQGTEQTKPEPKKKRRGWLSYIWSSKPKIDPKSEKLQNELQTAERPSKKESITLAWKWAPTENSHYDKGQYKGTVTKLCCFLGMSKKEYRKCCTLMRSHLGIVEAFMCGKKWDQIDFSKVPSRAMNIYKKAYLKHNPERFNAYLESVKKGEAKMNTGTLQPHEIVGQYLYTSIGERSDVEAQWTSFLNNLRTKGVSFDHSIAVVDTSGSMGMGDGIPANVACSLGLVLSEFCEGPFKNKWIEFSRQSKFHKFPEGSLYDKIRSITSIVENTNLQSVFDLILNTYTLFDIPEDRQLKRIFIFTDGQWDAMVDNRSSTHFQVIDKRFSDAGYKRPQIIFWNLRANTVDFPTECNVPDVALVSGFSSDLLQLFLDGGNLNPLSLVLRAINDVRYDRVRL